MLLFQNCSATALVFNIIFDFIKDQIPALGTCKQHIVFLKKTISFWKLPIESYIYKLDRPPFPSPPPKKKNTKTQKTKNKNKWEHSIEFIYFTSSLNSHINWSPVR